MAACRKTAITVPEDLLCAVDEAARSRGESRSRFINHVLRASVRARRDADITRRLNEVFADETTAPAHLASGKALAEAGSDWGDERW